ncbi:hypothetical protein EII34_05395 [Arachnia propionica]|uniref:Uncharacterized protein n=1 Tax=Arachnia propionica TaxID=1750 RepID=A0A3P1T9Q8_9ACTN|nr:DUF6177 family protein [Arachnia propionica]RRD06119.1 hypothetical protein EII34_05395 [Arachnia propionica]
MKVLHPLADEWADDYLLLACFTERVTLSAPIRSFLLEARKSQLKPVLLTSATAHLSWFVVDELRLAGGYWAVRDLDGKVYDGRTGVRIHAISELWGPVYRGEPLLPSFNNVTSAAQGAFFFDVFTRAEATERTTAGTVAEHMVVGLGGGPMARWDTCEPLAQPWEPAALTASMRTQMPASERHFGRSAAGGPVNVTLARTRGGVLEHTRGLVPVGDYWRPAGQPARAPIGAHPALTSTLTGLAERWKVNVALISYCQVAERTGSFGQMAERRHADAPAAVLIGPAAARSLGIDVADLASRYDVEPVGLTRAPSVLVRFSTADELWRQFVSFGHDLDQERLAALLATEFEELRSFGGG